MKKTIDLAYYTTGTEPNNPGLVTQLLIYASSAHKNSWTEKEKALLTEYVYHKVDEMYNIYDIISVKEDVAMTATYENYTVVFVVELKASNRAFHNQLFGKFT